MSAYINGNLARERKPAEASPAKSAARSATRRKSIPAQEKLLYLFTVAVCVIVAGAVIWRYAQIYELNARIQNIENEIKALQIENNKLRLEINKYYDPKRLQDEAAKYGLGPNERQLSQLTPSRSEPNNGDSSVALNKP
mgnify:CR=1 FL=1